MWRMIFRKLLGLVIFILGYLIVSFSIWWLFDADPNKPVNQITFFVGALYGILAYHIRLMYDD